jgi:hypothetical protein
VARLALGARGFGGGWLVRDRHPFSECYRFVTVERLRPIYVAVLSTSEQYA